MNDSGLFMRPDFSRMIPRIRKANLNCEFFIRTAKITDFNGIPCSKAAYKPDIPEYFASDYVPPVYDGTSDFNIRLYEHDAVIAALLSEALSRAEKMP